MSEHDDDDYDELSDACDVWEKRFRHLYIKYQKREARLRAIMDKYFYAIDREIRDELKKLLEG